MMGLFAGYCIVGLPLKRETDCESRRKSIPPKAKPDLILLDVMMPGIDGYETCRRLKRLPETQHTPILFITARGETSDIVAGFEARGLIFGAPLAIKLGCGFVPLRKPNKLPGKTIGEAYRYIPH